MSLVIKQVPLGYDISSPEGTLLYLVRRSRSTGNLSWEARSNESNKLIDKDQFRHDLFERLQVRYDYYSGELK